MSPYCKNYYFFSKQWNKCCCLAV